MILRKILALLFLLHACNYAQAQLRIEITQGGDNPTPIAIVPFAWSGGGLLSEDVSAVVSADLGRSGQFSPLSRADMLSQPSSQKEVFYKDWAIMGADYLVVGRVAPMGAAYDITYELLDVRTKQPIAKWSIGNVKDLRVAAHNISDTIYEKLTGLRGVFSTKIMYILVNGKVGGKRVYQLQIADADGERQKTLLQSSDPVMSPAWSPDGNEIAYVSFAGGRPAIYIQNRFTGQRTQLTNFRGINGAPDWSPDGQNMAMVLSKDGNPEIYVMNIRSRQLRRLTNHYAIDTEPRWTKDGRSLVFTSNRGGGPQIYKIDATTGQLTRLTYNGNYNARGQLSYDGSDLIMVHRENGLFHISVQDLQRDSFRSLTQTMLDESPSLAPNGSLAIYATEQGGRGVLGVVALSGNSKYVLPAQYGDVREPVWSPFMK